MKSKNLKFIPTGVFAWVLIFLFTTVGHANSSNKKTGLSIPYTKNATSSSIVALKHSQWWPAVKKRIKAQEYHIIQEQKSSSLNAKETYQAPNRRQNLRSYFTSKGVKVTRRTETKSSWHACFTLSGIGKNEKLLPLAEDKAPKVNASRIEFHRDAVVEWYENRPDGLEQGFTVIQKPIGNEPLYILLNLGGNIKPVLAKDGQTIHFFTLKNKQVMDYGGLNAFDAKGKKLSSHFELANNRLKIVVDDSSADYPIVIDPLLTTPAWTAEGNQAYADFGYAIGTAGDVNGDGYSDVIVGAHTFDTTGNQGKVFVYYGSASGPSTTADWTAESDQGNPTFFGTSVDTAGDVNGDGYSDIIIAADYYDSPDYVDDGRVFVYYGSESGLGPSGTPANADWTASGFQSEAYFGWEVSTAGDVDGDGYSDIIIGAYGYDTVVSPYYTDAGKAYAYYGSESGLSGTPDWTYDGWQDNLHWGNSVDTAGDFNGDGYDDVIVGGANNNVVGQGIVGIAAVFFGSATTGLSTDHWDTTSDQDNSQFGGTVRSAGDVNGDGYSDIIVGAYLYDNGQTDEGAAFLFHGSATGEFDFTAPDWSAENDVANAYFGAAVGTAGDVNNDGYSDVIVGAPGDSETLNGWAYVYYGSGSGVSTTADWSQTGSNSGDFYGFTVSTAGDVNNDGYSDVIVGANYYDNGQTDEGAAYLYFGAGDTANSAPAAPTAVSPADEASFESAQAITLKASAFSDTDGDSHAQTRWQVRRADNRELLIDETSATDLTQHSIAAGTLDPGLKYAWRARYQDTAGDPLWSAWSTETGFKIGTLEAESLPKIVSGTQITDFGMISFVHWPDDPDAAKVINIVYDTKYHRFGTYDPNIGGYVEYGNSPEIEPGKSYWVLVRDGLTINYNGIPVSLLNDIDVALSYNTSTGNGWNMIACPNTADYLWDDVQVVSGGTTYNMSDPAVDTLIDKRLWRWDNGAYFSNTTLMEKYKGYWVKTKQANVYLRFPVSAQAGLSNPKNLFAALTIRAERWLSKWIMLPKDAIADTGDSPPMPMGGLSSDSESSSGSSCFIDTAAYGFDMRPQVNILREFRNRCLLTHRMGKAFVDAYYKYSPALADVITKHDTLKTAVRISLLPAVGLSWIALNLGPVFTIALILVLFICCIGLIHFRVKRK